MANNESVAMDGESLIVSHHFDPDYQLRNADVTAYASWLGMDLNTDPEFRWIAEKGVMETYTKPLPVGWSLCQVCECDARRPAPPPSASIFLPRFNLPRVHQAPTGEKYYWSESGESRWDHPSDEEYSRLYAGPQLPLAPPTARCVPHVRSACEQISGKRSGRHWAKRLQRLSRARCWSRWRRQSLLMRSVVLEFVI